MKNDTDGAALGGKARRGSVGLDHLSVAIAKAKMDEEAAAARATSPEATASSQKTKERKQSVTQEQLKPASDENFAKAKEEETAAAHTASLQATASSQEKEETRQVVTHEHPKCASNENRLRESAPDGDRWTTLDARPTNITQTAAERDALRESCKEDEVGEAGGSADGIAAAHTHSICHPSGTSAVTLLTLHEEEPGGVGSTPRSSHNTAGETRGDGGGGVNRAQARGSSDDTAATEPAGTAAILSPVDTTPAASTSIASSAHNASKAEWVCLTAELEYLRGCTTAAAVYTMGTASCTERAQQLTAYCTAEPDPFDLTCTKPNPWRPPSKEDKRRRGREKQRNPSAETSNGAGSDATNSTSTNRGDKYGKRDGLFCCFGKGANSEGRRQANSNGAEPREDAQQNAVQHL